MQMQRELLEMKERNEEVLLLSSKTVINHSVNKHEGMAVSWVMTFTMSFAY